MSATGDAALYDKLVTFKESLKQKVAKANESLQNTEI